MSTVDLKEIYKLYGELQVVHGIDLTITSHEFVVLVGPSGCGKSTILRMVAGLEEISQGDLMIDGKVMNRIAPKDRDVAMVFQDYALYPHLNVADNIAFGLRIQKVNKEVISRSVTEVAGILNLTEYLDRRPADLSGGQRQRVAMGRAIVRQPKVFLFDEPLSNLDAKLRTQMRSEIRRLHNRLKVTSIYVTHDQIEAMTLADRIVVMNGGRIEQIGSPMEVFNNPVNTFVASFIGSPPMNQLHGTLDRGPEGISVILGDIRLKVQSTLQGDHEQGVIVGIRPEHVSLVPTSDTSPVEIKLDLVEPLGSEAILHTMFGNEPFMIKTETHGDVDHLSGLSTVHVPASLVMVFDAKTGMVMDQRG